MQGGDGHAASDAHPPPATPAGAPAESDAPPTHAERASAALCERERIARAALAAAGRSHGGPIPQAEADRIIPAALAHAASLQPDGAPAAPWAVWYNTPGSMAGGAGEVAVRPGVRSDVLSVPQSGRAMPENGRSQRELYARRPLDVGEKADLLHGPRRKLLVRDARRAVLCPVARAPAAAEDEAPAAAEDEAAIYVAPVTVGAAPAAEPYTDGQAMLAGGMFEDGPVALRPAAMRAIVLSALAPSSSPADAGASASAPAARDVSVLFLEGDYSICKPPADGERLDGDDVWRRLIDDKQLRADWAQRLHESTWWVLLAARGHGVPLLVVVHRPTARVEMMDPLGAVPSNRVANARVLALVRRVRAAALGAGAPAGEVCVGEPREEGEYVSWAHLADAIPKPAPGGGDDDGAGRYPELAGCAYTFPRGLRTAGQGACFRAALVVAALAVQAVRCEVPLALHDGAGDTDGLPIALARLLLAAAERR